MSELRPTTLQEIERVLDRSYFTKHSFTITNTPKTSPFLKIIFTPKPKFRYLVSVASDGSFTTSEAPGEHLASGEKNSRKTFQSVISALSSWIGRIQDDLYSAKSEQDEIEEFVEQFRSKIFATPEGEEEEAANFSSQEIQYLRDKLDSLQKFIEGQAEKIEISEQQIKKFEEEIANIKNDLSYMPKGVWKKVAGNKLLKSVREFLNTSEGRKLIADGFKKLIGME